jgi:hypothetical protein
MSEDNEEFLAYLEELGEAQVRLLMLNDDLPLSLLHVTRKWLADKDLESERLEAASTGKQIEIARSASEAAWTATRAAERASSAAERQAVAAERANTRATIALAIAIISIIATIVGIWLVHQDARRDTLHSPYLSEPHPFRVDSPSRSLSPYACRSSLPNEALGACSRCAWQFEALSRLSPVSAPQPLSAPFGRISNGITTNVASHYCARNAASFGPVRRS